MTDDVDDFLEHHGVLGMHWGHSKGGSGGSSKTGTKTVIAKPTRTERKVVKAKARVEKEKASQKEDDERDKAILTARKNIGKTGNNLALAHKQYKVDKLTVGKDKAKAKLGAAHAAHQVNVHDANLMTRKELNDESEQDQIDAVQRFLDNPSGGGLVSRFG